MYNKYILKRKMTILHKNIEVLSKPVTLSILTMPQYSCKIICVTMSSNYQNDLVTYQYIKLHATLSSKSVYDLVTLLASNNTASTGVINCSQENIEFSFEPLTKISFVSLNSITSMTCIWYSKFSLKIIVQ